MTKIVSLLNLFWQRQQLHRQRFNAGGFLQWSVGAARITKITEMEGTGFGPFLLPQARPESVRHDAEIPGGHKNAQGAIKLSVHSFVIEIAGRRILVDTGIGNHKRRKVPVWNRLNLPFLSDLALAGFPPDSIDTVVCTHLHTDHVGWNTRLSGADWIPTFRHARYLFGEEEFRFWQAALDDPVRRQVFSDSVQPVVDAKLVEFASAGDQIVPGVRLVATPGHTAHHLSVQIESEGEAALIAGDFVHHTAQVGDPQWSSSFDHDPVMAAQTRRRLFAQLADTRATLFGTAFPDPTAGTLVAVGDAFSFRPRPADRVIPWSE